MLLRRLIPTAISVCLVVSLGQLAFAETARPAGDGTFIKIFGCFMPLPPGYFLHTDTKSAGKFEFSRLQPFGKLNIGPYEPIRADEFDIVFEKSVYHLKIVQIKAKKEVIRNSPTLTVVHDGKRRVSIVGPDESWAERMAEYCVDHMARY